jgi:DEAD/DEAH box helicase domain-containing protein
MDTLVFDIETKNFFTDPGVGWDNFGALQISVVGVYSYLRDEYRVYEEEEMGALAALFEGARTIVGFSSNRYDVPVLNQYFQRLPASSRVNLWHVERVDLLEDIETATGKRISLSRLAEANLGVRKERQGWEAIELYREGRMDELKAYCLRDVELTKQLYDLYRERGYFFIPDRKTGQLTKLQFYAPHGKIAPLFS